MLSELLQNELPQVPKPCCH